MSVMGEDWSYPEQDYRAYDRPMRPQLGGRLYALDFYDQAQAANTQSYYRAADEMEAARAAMEASEQKRAEEKTIAVEDFDNTVWGQRARERLKPKKWWQFI